MTYFNCTTFTFPPGQWVTDFTFDGLAEEWDLFNLETYENERHSDIGSIDPEL